MTEITESTRKLEVTDSCDVLVCGGGVAGIAAALAAARNGAKTMLIEREFSLGGLATCGLVTIYLPLCDGCGHQVSFGISEELLRLSIKRGIMDDYYDPTAWLQGGTTEERIENRFRLQFNPHVFAADAEQLLLKEGVELLYGTWIADTRTEDGSITHVIIENKSGRSAVAAKSIVDCTGDADICRYAGEDTALYGPGNVLASWYYYASEETGTELQMLGLPETMDPAGTLRKLRYSGIDAKETTRFEILGREAILHDVMKKRETNPDLVPVTTASIPQFRMTRRICGAETLDVTADHQFEPSSVGMFSDWRKPGPVFELPYGVLFGKKVRNLITAGRLISVTDEMWDISRVIQVCAVSGQAAGTAAAMTDDFAALPVSELQSQLVRDGVVLHWNDLKADA